MGNVLYRKYRSKNLSEIVGQSHITTTLENAISSDKIAHAYLLTGPRGVGKTSVARIIAREVNKLGDDTEQNHLDIIEIDAASNRRIDEIRELREKVHNAPAQARYKVYIIDEVHMLTKEAFNALLKTLEEPPEHAIFILATTEAHKLPETIISRTQRFTFKSITVADISSHLKGIAKQEGINISDAALELIAKHSGGSFRDSLGLLDQARHVLPNNECIEVTDVESIIGAPSESVIDELFDSLLSSDAAATVASLQRLTEQGVDASYVASDISRRVRSSIIQTGTVTTNETQLLKDMTMVPSSPDPFLMLEISLLEYMSSAGKRVEPTAKLKAPNQRAESPREPKPEPKSKPTKAETKTVASPEPSKTKTSEISKPKAPKATDNSQPMTKSAGADAPNDVDAEAVWTEVLSTLKGAHNTLYGMARMAKPSVNKETFLLECKYAFHVKRLSDTYHHQILEKALLEQTGFAYQLSCSLVEKKKAQSTEPERPPVSTDDNPIETVSNIFGGAEVLES